jgi:hypothetical protein
MVLVRLARDRDGQDGLALRLFRPADEATWAFLRALVTFCTGGKR